jgi:signal transduction histidine kinase
MNLTYWLSRFAFIPLFSTLFSTLQHSKRYQHSYTIDIRTVGPAQAIVADKDSLYLVFDNLLSNAIKYANQDPVIQIEVVYEAEQVLIRVQDNGIGIPLEEQARLFNPFYRASNVGQVKGTGLGLSNVKTFIEAHGGTIDLESQLGSGSTFFIRLPYQQPQTEPMLLG